MHDLPAMLYPARILADQQAGEIFNSPNDRFGLPFQSGLPPTIKARLVCLHLHENPIAHARVDNPGRNPGNFQGKLDPFFFNRWIKFFGSSGTGQTRCSEDTANETQTQWRILLLTHLDR
jgi:hypothetical protein